MIKTKEEEKRDSLHKDAKSAKGRHIIVKKRSKR
jgi:hypothetical protein